MGKLLGFLVGIPAVAFMIIGAAWYTAPGLAAAQFDMDLQVGRGLGTQVADLGSFFLTLGICMLMGLRSKSGVWFYPAMMLLGIAAAGRVAAWLLHGASLTIDMIAVEVIVVLLLSFAARQYRSVAGHARVQDESR